MSTSSDVEPYGGKVRDAVAARGSLCLGIDPHPALLAQWGLTDDAAGLREFSLRVLEAAGDLATSIKPQIAFFEAYGSAGMAVLEEVCERARDAGALVIADAKRGDIGSTLAAYARAWLAKDAPFYCDALTLSPYLGVGALAPAFDLAAETGKGVYVLAATSNPEAVNLQNATLTSPSGSGGASTVAQAVADEVRQRNLDVRGGAAPSLGLVIGATVQNPPQVGKEHGPLLVPGFGAQGGSLADVQRVCGKAPHSAMINVSRSILGQGPDVENVRAATSAVIRELSRWENSD